MKTKQIIALALILALPITANAAYTYNDVQTPTRVANNGTVTIAIDGPYQTITPGEHDDEHIASTSYVIGAYNDTIAAVNNLATGKQTLLTLSDSGNLVPSGVIEASDFLDMIDMPGVLASSGAIVNTIDYKMNNQRVEVYTNWDDDSAKTDVAFKTVVPED